MKIRLFILLLLGTFIGCHKDDSLRIDSSDAVEGLSLYWDHTTFSEQGRVIRFEFYETVKFKNEFKLIFDYKIEGKKITISLIDKINQGECPKFPSPSGVDYFLCTPRGGIRIPDNLLSKGKYSLILKTYHFEVKSDLIIDDTKIVLNIPPNENKFSSYITTVYPVPRNVLFGSVVFSGKENTQQANIFFEELEAIGFSKTTLPNFPYRHLSVNDDGSPINEHWPPDRHSLKLLRNMNNDFKKAFELAKKHFNKSKLNIYLYSSNGDQAFLDKIQGITVEYAK